MPELSAAKYIPPLDFASDVLKVKLWDKQQEVLTALPDHRRIAVKSGNGLGKGYCAAVAVLWFLHCHNPAVVLSTAPTFRQVRHIFWRQIRRLYRPAKAELKGKMLETGGRSQKTAMPWACQPSPPTNSRGFTAQTCSSWWTRPRA